MLHESVNGKTWLNGKAYKNRRVKLKRILAKDFNERKRDESEHRKRIIQ